MAKKPVFAIIIPVYNGEKFISNCLNSLINQTHQEWIALCVNDGSTDNSMNLLNNYAQQDSRIKVFSKPNGGVSKARNFALGKLDNFQYDWISFVDIDDLVDPLRYEHIAEILESNHDMNVDYIRSYCQPFSNNGDLPESQRDYSFELVSSDEYFTRGDVGGFVCSCFLNRNLYERFKFSFPEDMKLMEDQVFSIKYALMATGIIYYRNKDYWYYTPLNTTNKYGSSRINDIVLCINKLYTVFQEATPAQQSYFKNIWLPSKIALYLTAKEQSASNALANNISLNPQISIWKNCKPIKSKLRYLKLKITGNL